MSRVIWSAVIPPYRTALAQRVLGIVDACAGRYLGLRVAGSPCGCNLAAGIHQCVDMGLAFVLR